LRERDPSGQIAGCITANLQVVTTPHRFPIRRDLREKALLLLVVAAATAAATFRFVIYEIDEGDNKYGEERTQIKQK